MPESSAFYPFTDAAIEPAALARLQPAGPIGHIKTWSGISASI
jgi:hypothetical protein